jgi:hypothetical protein
MVHANIRVLNDYIPCISAVNNAFYTHRIDAFHTINTRSTCLQGVIRVKTNHIQRYFPCFLTPLIHLSQRSNFSVASHCILDKPIIAVASVIIKSTTYNATIHYCDTAMSHETLGTTRLVGGNLNEALVAIRHHCYS